MSGKNLCHILFAYSYPWVETPVVVLVTNDRVTRKHNRIIFDFRIFP